MTFADRLNLALHARRMRPADLSKSTGKSAAYLSLLLSGKRSNPSKEIIDQLSSILRINPDWLMTGDGKMDRVNQTMAPESPAPDNIINPVDPRTMTDQELLDRIRYACNGLTGGDPYKAHFCAVQISKLGAEMSQRIEARLHGGGATPSIQDRAAL